VGLPFDSSEGTTDSSEGTPDERKKMEGYKLRSLILKDFRGFGYNCQAHLLTFKLITMAKFPDKEASLSIYFQVVVAYIILNFARLSITPANKTLLTDEYALWVVDYPLAITATTKTTTTVATKDKDEGQMKIILRSIYGDIPESVLTQTDRDTFNIPVQGGPHPHVPMPDSTPIGKVDAGARLHQVITLSDSASGKHAHPDGTSACEVWQKIGGPPPVLASDLTYIGSTSNAVFATDFPGTDAGLMVYYWMRWVNSRNEKGGWSPVFSANVQG